MALGLGSMDMPMPHIADWEWLNWTFPKPVRAGETIYAHWTLTQKRPAVGGAATAIAVWRVDLHTADGAICAAGEVGASVFRHRISADRPQPVESGAPTAAPRARRRRRRATPSAPIEPVAAAATAPAQAPASADRASGPRRRRRRRAPGTPAASNGEPASAGPAPEPPIPAPAPAAAAMPSPRAAPAGASPLSRVMRRLRRP